MSKRTNFAPMDRDLYQTIDRRAIPPIVPFIKPGQKFVEPFAGSGALIIQLINAGLKCAWASDIEPLAPGIKCADALTLDVTQTGADVVISNPPWTRRILHPMIEHYAVQLPTWFLFDAGWAYTGQASRLMNEFCTDVVVVGRLKWFRTDIPRVDGKKHTDPMDDCAWYRFHTDKFGATRFWPKEIETKI